jgi:Plasmid encoded RepA protein
MGPELTVRQLLIAGFPGDWIRAEFPEVRESAFVLPPPPEASRRRRPLTESAQRAGQGAGDPVLPARALADRVLHKTAAPSPDSAVAPPLSSNPTRNPTASSSVSGRASAQSAASVAATARLAGPAPDATRAGASVLSEGISFQYVPLIQCSFPHADPGTASQFTRRNGWLELTLATARPDTGLPYGVPARLLTIYCASEAKRTHSPEIYLGESIHDFLRRLDVPITRGERGSLRVYANQLLRLVHCALSIDENIRDAAGRTGLHIRQALFVEEARLWWDEASTIGQGSTLVLSPVLFDSILERSAPLSTKALRQLRKSPMDLDVYAWLVHRLFHLTRPSTVTWEQLSGQFGHGYRELRKFRRFFADSVQRVLEVYPEARLKLADVGVILLPSGQHIPRDALSG